MKLDIECIRDVLLELESFEIGNFPLSSFHVLIRKHGEDLVLYALIKLAEAKYINADYGRTLDGRPHIRAVYDITFIGHEFLADIKPQNTWEKLHSIFKQCGGASLKTIADVAVVIGTEALKIKLNLKT